MQELRKNNGDEIEEDLNKEGLEEQVQQGITVEFLQPEPSTLSHIASVLDIGEDWKELVDKAKKGTHKPDEYNTGTFTISNTGMFGFRNWCHVRVAG